MSLDHAAILAEARSIVSGTTEAESTEAESTEAESTEAESTEAGATQDEPSQAKGLSWAEALKTAPPELQTLLKGMQADYTRKTQALAADRKALAAEREALAKGRSSLPQAKGEVPEWDPWDEASVAARIEAEVARRLDAVLKPVEESYRETQAAAAYEGFVAQNPDLQTDQELRQEVGKLLQANENLDLETAYWAVKGRLGRTKAAHDDAKARAHREAVKKAAMATGTPRKVPAAQPLKTGDAKKMSNADILAYAQAVAKG